MYPNQPPSPNNEPYQPPQQPMPPTPPPSSIDYLNQIAPPPQKKGFDKKTKFILIIFGTLGILTLIFIIYASITQSNKGNASPSKLVARLEKLDLVSAQNNERLKSNDIRNINGSLMAVVSSAKSAIVNPAASLKLNLKKEQKEADKVDPSGKLTSRLDDAFLNNQLDATYAREMAFELQSTVIMMQQLNKNTTLKSFKEMLTKYSKDFSNLQKQFANYKDKPTVINNPAMLPLRADLTPGYSSGAPSL